MSVAFARTARAVFTAVFCLHVWVAGAQALPTMGAVPVLSATGPDSAAYGEAQGYPVEMPLKRQQNMVGNYSHSDRLFATRASAPATKPSLLDSPLAIHAGAEPSHRSLRGITLESPGLSCDLRSRLSQTLSSYVLADPCS